jgi:hypothetical protein
MLGAVIVESRRSVGHVFAGMAFSMGPEQPFVGDVPVHMNDASAVTFVTACPGIERFQTLTGVRK